MSTELRQALEEVAYRFRMMRLWSSLAVGWLAWAIVGLGLTAVPGLGFGWFVAWVIGLTATTFVCSVLSLWPVRNPRWVARRIEAKHPELKTGLLAAVEEAEALPAGQLGYLQTAVIRQALEHRRLNEWKRTVPAWRLRGAQAAFLTTFALMGVVSGTLFVKIRSLANRPDAAAVDTADYKIKVDPGSTSIERGSTLLVVARFQGTVPPDATLVVEGEPAAREPRVMSRSLEDPTFAGRVESVNADLTYRVEFAGRGSERYRVKVFEYPEVRRTDAALVFPGYTSQEPRTVEDIRHVTAVEGTDLTLRFHLNKDVAQARMVDQSGEPIALTRDEGDAPHVYRATLKLAESRRFRVNLVDRENRTNRLPAEVVVNVTPNRPAVVTMLQPSRDVRVSPVEELAVRASLEDDFGVVRHGVSYTAAGREAKEVVLKSPDKTSKKVKADYLLDMESLKAAPDQLVTYYFWAEDIGPDGKPRRSSGDMFFAEVRHFEEIFRQGEQAPSGSAENENEGQQEGNAEQANKLAELQKEIINATWKVVRRETGAKPTAKLAEDGKLLQESQRSAIEQAKALAERLQDQTSKANLDQATRFMKDAETRLTELAESSSIKALSPALAAEQAAYQALLKLRAREFEVTRSNSRQRQQGSRSGSAGPSQRQLNQLELSAEENRYEEQSKAKAQQDKLSKLEQEQRETRQVVNRLRELAQRQTDLNDRLKELQSALEAAKDQQTREEIERQLKRLRDQQQQILRDTDEVQERMEREENRERMADARQQVEESREHVRQASEALEQGKLSQAVTEGARAGRQLNDLREELRKKASDRFAEDMTDMRSEARRLDENQKKVTEQIDAGEKRPQRSLRENGEGEKLKQSLEQQGKQLGQLVDRMKDTVQEAEETEPLLAKELFDTVRKANEKTIPEALKEAEQLLDAGIADEAVKSSQRAGEGIGQLREGVERAAESVLGDETSALKRAQGELEDLAEQVNREIAGSQKAEPTDRKNASNRPATKGQEGRQKGEAARDEAKGENGPPDQNGQPGQGGQRRGEGQAGKPQQDEAKEEPGSPPNPEGQQGQGGQRGGEGQPGQPRQRGGGSGGRQGLDRLMEGAANGPGGPITGEGFRQWSDRMRDVEELLTDTGLRTEAARIRDRARGAREEFKRHAKEPDWNQLKSLVADPIRELRDRVAEEVRRRESPDALVPIDRDPVPPQYAEGVRRYYERLGSGR